MYFFFYLSPQHEYILRDTLQPHKKLFVISSTQFYVHDNYSDTNDINNLTEI